MRRIAHSIIKQLADEVLAEVVGAGILAPLGVAVDGRRGWVLVLDEDDGIQARLVDVVTKVGGSSWIQARRKSRIRCSRFGGARFAGYPTPRSPAAW
jgi:hypothetical protein